ncbi:MAG: prolipoprotein diacylglyceryl transferase [Planctomycetota bacterium]
MYPELLRIPFTTLTIKSYGLMMVVGFLAAIFLIRRLSRNLGHSPDHIINAALYSLIAGVFGARAFYVIHYFEQFHDNPLSIFAIWQGGLELLGGVVLAISVIVIYIFCRKLPIRRYLDILAIALMSALAIGRIGCFLNGCCFGKPTKCPIAVRFPYASPPYYSQVFPDYGRNRSRPYLELPNEYYGRCDGDDFIEADQANKFHMRLKPPRLLSEQQRYEVTKGRYQCLPVHPTQIYSSVGGLVNCGLLYLFWRRSQRAELPGAKKKMLARPGCTFGLMLVLYGAMRFLMEFMRDDNPFEAFNLTVSQFISIALIIFGAVLMIILDRMSLESRPEPAPVK